MMCILCRWYVDIHHEEGSVKLMWMHVDRRRRSKPSFHCGRHKWMTSKWFVVQNVGHDWRHLPTGKLASYSIGVIMAEGRLGYSMDFLLSQRSHRHWLDRSRSPLCDLSFLARSLGLQTRSTSN